MNLTGSSAVSTLNENVGGNTSGSIQQAIPTLRLTGAISGRAVVSDDTGTLYMIDADHGTIKRIRWE